LPEAQAEFVRQMEDWFAKRGKYPDRSTIKKKVALLWRRFHKASTRG
jgi:hypothetical protein